MSHLEVKRAIEDEAALFGGKVTYLGGKKHPKFEIVFPNGISRRNTFSGSPADDADEIGFARQKVRRMAKSAGAELKSDK